jgi:hypothetical protein
MNERIRQLALQAGIQDNPDQEGLDLFVELIVKECVRECQQEWYDLNNTDPLTDPRLVAMLVGQKNGVIKSISRIKKHFGVEE